MMDEDNAGEGDTSSEPGRSGKGVRRGVATESVVVGLQFCQWLTGQ